MAIHINQVMLQPIIALIAGIPILVVPRILNYIVAIYLIIVACSACGLTFYVEWTGDRCAIPRDAE